MDDQTLGRWLRFLREQRGMTQQQVVAEIWRLTGGSSRGVWISDSTISSYEKGNVPGRVILPAYAAALDVSLNTLLAPRSVDFEKMVIADLKKFKP